ncbi:MAG: hypothetical protein LUG50_09720 [Planctomycetaceae bacterium]|nr:hypothetical protein [Planctomycetaceae bacterium]
MIGVTTRLRCIVLAGALVLPSAISTGMTATAADAPAADAAIVADAGVTNDAASQPDVIAADAMVDAAVDATPGALTLAEADTRLDIAMRMLQGGIYDRALQLANSVLDHPDADPEGRDFQEMQQWLARREKARFIRERGRFGLAATRADYEDVAQAFVHLSNNRYRLQEPAFNVQSAYWAARAFEMTEDYRDAVDQYTRVGGVTLPPGMEGDAAQRTSRCLRELAEEVPYPGTLRDRQRRDHLLNQAISELDRARLAFPVGNRRKEIELDLIALRMARREEQFVREAATEAEGYIESDPAKDELRARAALYRGQAAAMLGNQQDAAVWFRRVVQDEAPGDDDRRAAELGLGLAQMEMAGSAGVEERNRLLRLASEALDRAIDGTASPGPWDGARVVKARVQLLLDQPTAALETLAPVLAGGGHNPPAWHVAGIAELRRGRLGESFHLLYPAARPSTTNRNLRYTACRDASRTADLRREYGMALALNHTASRMLRRDRLFGTLLVSEFQAMETILKLGKMGGPMSLSSDIDLLTAASDAPVFSLETRQADVAASLGQVLGNLLFTGGDPDSGFDLGITVEAADEWSGDGIEKLELAIGLIAHLRKREPAGVTDSVLSSRLGEARHALALARADRILKAPIPDPEAIDRTLGDFAAAAASFQEASAGGFSIEDSLNQGMVNMESGAFLMELSRRWERGQFAARSLSWRDEARQRIEASLRPFNQAIATSGPSSLASRRAKWSRGRALELMGEWRGAAVDYLSLMNNSELPRILRANAARRWAECMGKLGENRTALTRLAVFTEIDAEAALLAGHLADEAGYPREAYQYYLFAADPDSPAIPPATPGRVQDAAYHAAQLALGSPNSANPLLPPEQVVASARELLIANARADLRSTWAVPILNLLRESYLGEPGGYEAASRLATDVIDIPGDKPEVDRAMYILAAKAQAMAGNYDQALDELDYARDLLDDTPDSRRDAAFVTLETARVYRSQNRREDALRAYADVFAMYPEQEETDDAARTESAVMLLTGPDRGPAEAEMARSILSGLRDQMAAQKIMRDYGIH